MIKVCLWLFQKGHKLFPLHYSRITAAFLKMFCYERPCFEGVSVEWYKDPQLVKNTYFFFWLLVKNIPSPPLSKHYAPFSLEDKWWHGICIWEKKSLSLTIYQHISIWIRLENQLSPDSWACVNGCYSRYVFLWYTARQSHPPLNDCTNLSCKITMTNKWVFHFFFFFLHSADNFFCAQNLSYSDDRPLLMTRHWSNRIQLAVILPNPPVLL